MNSDDMMKNYFGDNYVKAMKTASEAKADAWVKFLKKYPDADASKFNITVIMKKDGTVESIDTEYIIDDDTSVDIDADSFTNNPVWMASLEWPPPWGVRGTVQNFTPNSRYTANPRDIDIFVTNELSFRISLDAPDIENNTTVDYKTNSYMAALYAAYIATYLCGISTEHFVYKPSVPSIVTSLARYHLYYQMMRFMKNPSKMSRYISTDVSTIVSRNKPTKVIWESKMHYGREDLGTWLSGQARGTIRNAKPVLRGNQGQVGIRYQKAVRREIVGLGDYKVFVASESNGLTKLGQLLFQQSIESYVYCILGAQAKTRWPIVRSGARSLQTQEVFRKLVGDTVLQDDHTVTLSNMRGAIKSTNVVLNTAVSPGIILIPSDMIILDKMIAGYNNVLTIATSGMRFGHNENVNFFKHKDIKLLPQTPPVVPKAALRGASVEVPTRIPEIRRGKALAAPPTATEDPRNLYAFLASGIVGTAAVWLIL